MPKVAIVYHSGYGHTAVIANEVTEGAREGGAEAVLLPVESGQTDFEPVFAEIASADAVIFGSPTYMGSVAAPFKAFMDASSKPWFAQAWKDKLAAGFTVSGGPSGDKLNTLTTLAVFAGQHSMIWVSLGLMPGGATDTDPATDSLNRLVTGLGALGQASNVPPTESPKAGDKATGRHLGRRVAEAAARWTHGGATPHG